MKRSLLRCFLITIIFILSENYVTCQVQERLNSTNFWMLNQNSGLDFKESPPEQTSDCKISPDEGSSSISDENGIILYSDGLNVYDSSGTIVLSGLLGEKTSTQTVLILKLPKSHNVYFVFTVSGGVGGKGNGFRYSVLEQNEKDWIVKDKNVLIQSDVSEKLCATLMQNNADYWIIAHGNNNNEFFTYSLTSKGFNSCPVINKIGHTFKNLFNKIGAMKFSSDGRILAVSLWADMAIELFEFNKEKGILSNPLKISNIFMPYGLEFSHNSKFLYVSERERRILQYNLENWNEQKINNSLKTIFDNPNNLSIGALQIARNKKIYIAIENSNYLATINLPELEGADSDFIEDGQLLNELSTHSLPSFPSSSLYQPEIDFSYIKLCGKNEYKLSPLSIGDSKTISWEVCDKTNNCKVTTQNEPILSFDKEGEYLVTIHADNNLKHTKTITILNEPFPVSDSIIFNQTEIELSVDNNYRCLEWENGDNSYNRVIKNSGTYSLKAFDFNGCEIYDTIDVNFKSLPKPTIKRHGDSLYTTSTSPRFVWYHNGKKISNFSVNGIKVYNNGYYQVEIFDSVQIFSIKSDSVHVTSLTLSELEINDIKVFPIPASNYLNIDFSGSILNSPSKIELFDLQGKAVFKASNKSKLSTFKIPLSQKGIFILRMTYSNGKTIHSKIISE